MIDTVGRYLFQQRDDVPSIVYPGKVGLFGGHREGTETYLECIVREIHEELSYYVSPGQFEHLAFYSVDDVNAEGGAVCGEFFIARDLPCSALRVTEGSLFIVDPDKLTALENLTPSAQFAINAVLERPVTPAC